MKQSKEFFEQIEKLYNQPNNFNPDEDILETYMGELIYENINWKVEKNIEMCNFLVEHRFCFLEEEFKNTPEVFKESLIYYCVVDIYKYSLDCNISEGLYELNTDENNYFD